MRARVRLALGDGGDDVGARHARVGDEALAAVEHPAVVDQPGPRAGAARVRPGARFGQPVGPQHLAAGHGAQVALLLLIGAGQVDRVAAEAGVRRNDDPDAAAGAGQLLDGDGVGQGVEARAAELLRVRNAQQAQLRRLADDLVRELALALQLVGDRHDLALGEVAHRAPDLFVLRAEGEVHAAPVGGFRGVGAGDTARRRVYQRRTGHGNGGPCGPPSAAGERKDHGSAATPALDRLASPLLGRPLLHNPMASGRQGSRPRAFGVVRLRHGTHQTYGSGPSVASLARVDTSPRARPILRPCRGPAASRHGTFECARGPRVGSDRRPARSHHEALSRGRRGRRPLARHRARRVLLHARARPAAARPPRCA